VEDFDAEMLADYRRCWRDPAMIHGTCSDYRAAATIDLEHDGVDIEKKVLCPTLAFFGANGTMAKNFDIPAQWRKRCADVKVESLPGGHFFIDQFPEDTARVIARFVGDVG
jgi:haloacetate dehalogenase